MAWVSTLHRGHRLLHPVDNRKRRGGPSGNQGLWLGSLDIAVDDLSKPGQVLQLGVKPNRIDLITSISGVEFESAWMNRSPGQIDGIAVQFIGRDALIANKESTGRPKDLGDVAELRRRNPNH